MTSDADEQNAQEQDEDTPEHPAEPQRDGCEAASSQVEHGEPGVKPYSLRKARRPPKRYM